jgi:hypothetical protein
MLLTPLMPVTPMLASPPPVPDLRPSMLLPQVYQWQEPPFTRQNSKYHSLTTAATATHAGAKLSPWSSNTKGYETWLMVHPPLLTPLQMPRPILIGANTIRRPTSNLSLHLAPLLTTMCLTQQCPRKYGTCSRPSIKAAGNCNHITFLRGYS